MKNNATGPIFAVVVLAGLGAGGYFAYRAYSDKHPKPKPEAAPAPNPYAPAPYVPTTQLGIKPLEQGSPALAPQLAVTADSVMAKMQADWDAKLLQQQATLEAQYQADLARQSNAREADMLRLQRESAAREAELMTRQQEELRRSNELIQQADQSRQRELETIRRQEEARQTAERTAYQNRVTVLNDNLRGVQDQIKLVEVRLNTLNTSQPDAAFRETVRAMLEAGCRQYYGIFGIGCENPKPAEMDARLPVEWQKKLTADRVPLVAELDVLRGRERNIQSELGSLAPAQTSLNATPSNLQTMVMQYAQTVARPLAY
jgi:hypothetical protein